MRQIQFTFWPWKLLTLIMPVMAVAAGIMFSLKNEDKGFITPATVVLGILGAGNAYIMAIASGNLGRTVLSVPVGALTGLLPAALYSCRPLFFVYGLFIVGWAVLLIMHWAMLRLRHSSTCITMLLAFAAATAALTYGTLAVAAASDIMLLQIPVCFPFNCACIAACMITNTKYKGAPEGVFDSVAASLYGLMIAALAAIPLAMLMSLLPRLSPQAGEVLFGGALLIICNYFFMKNFFSAIVRIIPDAPVPAGPDGQPAPAENLKDSNPGGGN